MRQRQKRVKEKVFLTITIATVSSCVAFILLYLFVPRPQALSVDTIHVPTAVVTQTKVAPVAVPAVAVPTRLTISSINVDAAVNQAGLTSTGNMDIDENPTEVAWYKLGPKPGEIGSAVIAGHYGWKDGVPSVFNDLNKLVKGDTISTIGDDGQTKTFAVNHTALYTPDQDATDVFTSNDGKAHLNLITCQGTWVNAAQSYNERLIVFTDYVK